MFTETNEKRVLGVVGSPRRGGNTETLVAEVLRGAEEAGAHIEVVTASVHHRGEVRQRFDILAADRRAGQEAIVK